MPVLLYERFERWIECQSNARGIGYRYLGVG